MPNVLQGAFHFHSNYSHDGKSPLDEIASGLKQLGLSFCIMTEHFEDFDASKFSRYLQEAETIGRSRRFVLIPGVEVHLGGLDTILFPVRDYDSVARFASGGEDDSGLFKVLAHPTKYSWEAVSKHLASYRIDALEMWNQQADSRYLPPLALLQFLKAQSWRGHYHYFFGCDLHSMKLSVSNVISVEATGDPMSEAIVRAIRDGNFESTNRPTGIRYRNGTTPSEFDAWVEDVTGRTYVGGRIRRSVRAKLKSLYKSLPGDMQHSLNDFKNFVRNKV
jgi:hypothetical protein